MPQRKKTPQKDEFLPTEEEYLELLSEIEEQKDTIFFLQKKFMLLLFASLFLIGVFAILYFGEKAENDLRANLLNRHSSVLVE